MKVMIQHHMIKKHNEQSDLLLNPNEMYVRQKKLHRFWSTLLLSIQFIELANISLKASENRKSLSHNILYTDFSWDQRVNYLITSFCR